MKLLIESKRDGFRRAGRAWSEKPTEVDSSEFTADQLKALRAEPMLRITEAAQPPAAQSAKPKA